MTPPFRFRRVAWLAALCAVGAGALLLAYRGRDSSGTALAAPSRDVLVSELQLIEGRLHRPQDDAPFTGRILERYPDGALKSRSCVSNGLLEGLSEGWGPEGRIQITEHFHQGVSHGTRTKWRPDGTRLSEAQISSGKLHGRFQRWHESGAVAEIMEFREGTPDGVSKAYYPSGCMKAWVLMRDGKPVEEKFWKDGERRDPPVDGAVVTE
jgi:antitoxin component YwqK of YwqJK toxin-antitoxin module